MTLEPLRGSRGRHVRRNQRGATAVVVALLMTALLAAGALGLDISKLVFERQQVRAAIDAAAQIGATRLTPIALGIGGATALVNDIKKAAVANYGSSTYGPGLTLGDVTVDGVTVASVQVEFYCVVANTSGNAAVGIPDAAQIPSTCRPNPASTNYTTGTKCSVTSCAIPCSPLTVTGAVCNAVKVTGTKQVQFVLAPAIGIDHGKAVASTVSCQGSCGGESAPKPMNVVVMADRTPSMWGTVNPVNASTGKAGGPGDDFNLIALRKGVEDMLKVMTPEQQYVAFGAIHQSATVTNNAGADNLTPPLGSGGKIFTETTSTATTCYGWRWNTQHIDANCNDWRTTTTASRVNKFSGTWVPVGFTKTYRNPDRTINTNSDLYASVHNLAYSNLTTSGTNGISATYIYNKLLSDGGSYSNSGTGTHLAAALKGAATYLLDKVDSNNHVSGLDDGFREDLNVPVQNVIIFETDGQPDEVFDNATNDSAIPLGLGNTDDIGSKSNDYQACRNFKKVADEVKAAGILMITIGFGSVNSATCNSTLSARSMLAYAASTTSSVTGTGTADSDCSTPAEASAENSDADYYYCATSTTDLSRVFEAAMGDMTKRTKFMAIDGVGD